MNCDSILPCRSWWHVPQLSSRSNLSLVLVSKTAVCCGVEAMVMSLSNQNGWLRNWPLRVSWSSAILFKERAVALITDNFRPSLLKIQAYLLLFKWGWRFLAWAHQRWSLRIQLVSFQRIGVDFDRYVSSFKHATFPKELKLNDNAMKVFVDDERWISYYHTFPFDEKVKRLIHSRLSNPGRTFRRWIPIQFDRKHHRIQSGILEFRRNPTGSDRIASETSLSETDRISSENFRQDPIGFRFHPIIRFRRKRWDPILATIVIENGAQLSWVSPNNSTVGWGIPLTVPKPQKPVASIMNQ